MLQDDQINALLSEANTFVAQGDLPKASEAFRQIFEINPTHTMALRGLGEAMLKSGQHDIGLALLADSIDLEWPDVSTVIRISEILKSLDRNNEAADLLFASVHAKPDSLELRQNADALLSSLGRTEDLQNLANIFEAHLKEAANVAN